MKDYISRELVIAASVILLLLLLSTTGFFVTNELFLSIVVVLTIMLGVFGILIRNPEEESEDPRDRRTGDRAAFFTAAGALSAAILAEALTSHVDTWLWVILGVGILAKVIGLWRRRS